MSEVTKLGTCLLSTNQHATTLLLIAQSRETFVGTYMYEWRENSETIQSPATEAYHLELGDMYM